MESISFIQGINILAPIFLIMCCGLLFRHLRLVDSSYVSTSNKLLFYFFLPIFLFVKTSESNLKNPINIKLVLGYYLSTLIIFFTSFLFAKIKKYNTSKSGSFIQGAFRGNIGYIGLAIMARGYGDKGIFLASVLLAFLTPIINFLAILAFFIPRKNFITKDNLNILIKDILLNPIIISGSLGMMFNTFNLSMPDILHTTLSYISNVTLPLALFIIGASIQIPKYFNELYTPIFCNVFKLMIMPMVTYFILKFCHVSGLELATGVIFAAAPTAVVTYIFASEFEGDTELAVLIVVVSVIFSFFTYPLIFRLIDVA